MSTIPTGQFILIDTEILNDSSLTLPNNHTQGKKTIDHSLPEMMTVRDVKFH